MKIIKHIIIRGLGMLGMATLVRAQDADFPYDIGDAAPTSDIGDILKENTIDNENSDFQNIIEEYELSDNVGDGENTGINFVIRLINIALGLVSFIALIYLIYTFYRLFFTNYESGVSYLRKVITGLIIAILIIGLSRFIVSYIFEARGIVRDGLG